MHADNHFLEVVILEDQRPAQDLGLRHHLGLFQDLVRLSSSRPGGDIQRGVSCAVLVAVIVLFPLAWVALIAAVGPALGIVLRGKTQTLDSMFELADILDDRDKYTHGHSERVGYYAEQTAVQLGLSGDRAHLTFLAGRLHDIGKCAINNEVLLKPARLDEDEQSHMRRHPEVGGAMLAHFTLFRDVATYVRGHHERWDGKGYPDGLRGQDIALESRIIAVVDSYDAMTTSRPYRAALPHTEACPQTESRSRRAVGPARRDHVRAVADQHSRQLAAVELVAAAA